MFLLRRTDRPASRGQGLVEFALVLPLLSLLLIMAIDFGRVFFGWVALQNAARIGADMAAQSWDSWPTADNAAEVLGETRYQTLISEEMTAANCDFTTPHPDPTFTDLDGDGDINFGDLATVELSCGFGLITPLADNLFGGPLDIAASSTFAVNGVVVRGVPDPPPPADPCSDPNASFTTIPSAGTGGRINGAGNPFVVDFTATALSAEFCEITYEWTVDGTTVGTGQLLDDEEFTDPPGGGHTDYDVELTVTNADGESATDDIIVRVAN